jgi:hypothetical protein
LIDAGYRLTHNGRVSDAEQEATISQVTDRLAARFPEAPRQRIESIVGEEYHSLDTGRIRIYVPTLVENSARSRLHRESGQPADPE